MARTRAEDLWRPATPQPRRGRGRGRGGGRDLEREAVAELSRRRADHDRDRDQDPGRDQEPSPLRQVVSEASRLRRRYRSQGLPLAAIGGTHVLGAAADAAGLLPLGLGVAAAAGSYGYAHHHADSRWDRVYAATAAAGSVGWQTTAALTGADGVMPAVLWLGGGLLALPYWIRHTDPDPDVTLEREQPQSAPAPLADQPDQRVVAFGRHLGAKGKPLAGAALADVADFAYGWRAEIHLPTGHHWHEVTRARDAIASVYDLPDGRVCIEPLPGQSVRRVRLTVLTVDPLERVHPWTGPGLDPATGTFPLMTTADGDTLPFRLWYPGGGACHALVAGATGSGKSAVLDLILAELAYSDRYIPWIIDGGEGASNPDWVDSDAVGHAATTPADARQLLSYALRVAKARKRYLRRTKRRSIDPTPAMPGIAIVIDEAHNLLMGDANADIRRAVETLTQEGRKVAISVILATQVPSAAQLGGSTVIRNMLKSGTVVGLRTLERTAANMAGGDQPLPEPLHQLPAEFPDGEPTRGLGYMLTHRLIRARALFYDPQEWAAHHAPIVALDEWTAAVEQPNLTGDDDGGLDEVLGADQPVVDHTHAATRVSSADTTAAVRQALDAGTEVEVAALMAHTGLPMGAVRRALAQLN